MNRWDYILKCLRLLLTFGIFLTIILAPGADTALKDVIIASTVASITGESIIHYKQIKNKEKE